ncbi:MAG: M28 family peptidase [Spirochaetales bacterium]|nr:M28 family peptidase [Spirochaetales bacterium]
MLPSGELKTFCAPQCDRYLYLKEWFDGEEITASVIQTGELKHFLIRPGGDRCFHNRGLIKTLVAHYDRFPGSPGANDNSASVFQLLQLIRYLKESPYTHNCQILLTDGEELHDGAGRISQGSYLLGELFKSHGIDRTVMIILDMCGIGDTLVYSTGQEKLTGKKSPREEFLLKPILDLIPTYSRGKSLSLTEQYSDDLGFLAHGFLTLQVSLIPWKERNQIRDGQIPESWQTMHTPWDKPDKLEKRAFRIMEGFLKGISKIILKG